MKLIGTVAETMKQGPIATPAWTRACDHLLYNKRYIINTVMKSGIDCYGVAVDIRDAAQNRIGEE